MIAASRTERRRTRNRQALVSAARRLFVRDGFERTTIAAIAEEADLGFGTFYRYFPDKDAALAAVVDDVEQDIDAVLLAESAPGETAAGALAGFTRAFGAMVQRNRDVFLLVWQLGMRDARASRPGEDFPFRLGATLGGLIGRGVESGEFEPVDVEVCARLLTGAHMSLIAPPRLPNDDSAVDALCAFELRALRATPEVQSARNPQVGNKLAKTATARNRNSTKQD